jgi:hypothetical protein
MKNIHLLPTDKPSRLQLQMNGNFHIENGQTISLRSYQNIYITNDEEITGFENNIWVIKEKRIFLWQNTMALVSNNKPKKIILTTDQDLIKDGVQAIDDEFLEWFVKNPSCESVEVEKQMLCDYCGQEHCDNLRCKGYKDSVWYKIIIPKEEPTMLEEAKQRAKNYMSLKGALEPKQETTLEEAAERLYPFAFGGIGNSENDKKNHFVKGAKWQAKRMYSEEDMKSAIEKTVEKCNKMMQESYGLLEIDVDYIFEQFKKK